MANTIQIKRSETANAVPTTGNLSVGELGINIVDQKIYTRDSSNNIVVLSETINGKANLELVSTDAGSAAAPIIDFYRNSFSPFDTDAIGEIKFQGKNDAGGKIVFSKITTIIDDASSSTEDGSMEFHVVKNGADTTPAKIKNDGLHLTTGNKITFPDGTSQTTAPTTGTSIAVSIALG
mgnify:FL=1|tara:strand:+ start:552 stop:1088 length:537 start_codon:yes stop_codon:yes gene_type:complete